MPVCRCPWPRETRLILSLSLSVSLLSLVSCLPEPSTSPQQLECGYDLPFYTRVESGLHPEQRRRSFLSTTGRLTALFDLFQRRNPPPSPALLPPSPPAVAGLSPPSLSRTDIARRSLAALGEKQSGLGPLDFAL